MLLTAQVEHAASPQAELHPALNHEGQVHQREALGQVEVLLVVTVEEVEGVDAFFQEGPQLLADLLAMLLCNRGEKIGRTSMLGIIKSV